MDEDAQSLIEASHESVPDRLAVLEALVRWIYDNQIKQSEMTKKTISEVKKVAERVEVMKVGIHKFSEDFNYWMREARGNSETDTTYTGGSDASSDDEGTLTDDVEDKYHP